MGSRVRVPTAGQDLNQQAADSQPVSGWPTATSTRPSALMGREEGRLRARRAWMTLIGGRQAKAAGLVAVRLDPPAGRGGQSACGRKALGTEPLVLPLGPPNRVLDQPGLECLEVLARTEVHRAGQTVTPAGKREAHFVKRVAHGPYVWSENGSGSWEVTRQRCRSGLVPRMARVGQTAVS